jgi:hypothetical protein
MRGHTWAYFHQRDEARQRFARLCVLAVVAGLLLAVLVGKAVGR